MVMRSAEGLFARRRLAALQSFLTVVYALLFFEMILYLPPAEDMAWAESQLGLLQFLIDNRVELLRVVIGGGLSFIYWNTSITGISLVNRTSGTFTLLQLLQLAFVCLFVYFAISDPLLSGGPSSPALQCVSLCIAGLLGLGSWHHACAAGLVEDDLSKAERNLVAARARIAPLTALLNIPLAFVGPIAWTLGWIAIPVAIEGLPRLSAAVVRFRSDLRGH